MAAPRPEHAHASARAVSEQMLVRKIKDIRVTAIVTAMSFVLNDVLMKGGSQILKRANYL